VISLDDRRAGDAETEIGRLTLALQQERERRVMAALWGSRDDRCPYAFSLYSDTRGSIAYGVRFHDGVVLGRAAIAPASSYMAASVDEVVTHYSRDEDRPATVVWLSEDVGDLTDAITEDVREAFRRRAQSDPVDSTWHDCLNLADAALGALFADDGPDSP
jgi:hypothetical protein